MKAKITSGVMYDTTINDESNRYVRFVMDDNGKLYTWDNHNNAIEIPVEDIKRMRDIHAIYLDFTMFMDENGIIRIWDDVVFRHDGEYYVKEDAIDEIKEDDDLFREYVDENARYVDVCNHSYYTDYDTLDNWGILDDIREDWSDEVEYMLDNEYFNDWELVGDCFNGIVYYLLDNGTVVNSETIDKAMVSELISIVMESCETDNRIGDWIVTRAPTEINDVNTNVTTPTINPDSERPISLT